MVLLLCFSPSQGELDHVWWSPADATEFHGSGHAGTGWTLRWAGDYGGHAEEAEHLLKRDTMLGLIEEPQVQAFQIANQKPKISQEER